jgi:hypothetical protein
MRSVISLLRSRGCATLDRRRDHCRQWTSRSCARGALSRRLLACDSRSAAPRWKFECTPTKPGRRPLPLKEMPPHCPLTMRDHRVRERVKPAVSSGFSNSGGGIRTRDLRVMSPSDRLSPPPIAPSRRPSHLFAIDYTSGANGPEAATGELFPRSPLAGAHDPLRRLRGRPAEYASHVAQDRQQAALSRRL